MKDCWESIEPTDAGLSRLCGPALTVHSKFSIVICTPARSYLKSRDHGGSTPVLNGNYSRKRRRGRSRFCWLGSLYRERRATWGLGSQRFPAVTWRRTCQPPDSGEALLVAESRRFRGLVWRLAATTVRAHLAHVASSRGCPSRAINGLRQGALPFLCG